MEYSNERTSEYHPLGPIGALVENVELARPLGDGQFEQLYHALLKHQVLFFRNQPITPLQQRDLAGRFGDLHIHPVYPHATDVEEIIVLDTHNDNPPDNDNWHTDVTFIENPPLGAITRRQDLAFHRRRYAVGQRHRGLRGAVGAVQNAARRAACGA